MTKKKRVAPAILEKVARLTADLTDTRNGKQLARLRRMASAVITRADASEQSPVLARGASERVPVSFDDEAMEAFAAELEADADLPSDDAAEEAAVLELRRSDAAPLVEGTGFDRLSGLRVSERIGPFLIGHTEVWFDTFFAARARTVVRTGSPRPLLALSKARVPRVAGGKTTVELEEGTVWVRGDQLSGALPANAYVGIQIVGGTLTIAGNTTQVSDALEIGGALKGELELELAATPVAAAADGCRAAQAVVEPPRKLVLTFTGSGVTTKSDAGRGTAWGQSFEFSAPNGTWTFIDALWTVVLGYEVAPTAFSTDPITDELVTFSGKARIERGGLGFPVVVVADPTVLDEASGGLQWWLDVRGFEARWYEPDPRVHTIDAAWLGILTRGTLLYAADVAPLSPPVAHDHALWAANEGGGRVPWTQSYAAPFYLLHRCDVLDGEVFAVSGAADVALDRPVRTSGAPLPRVVGTGLLALRRRGTKVDASLIALQDAQPPTTVQLALRNALVWATPPAYVLARGRRDAVQSIAAGTATVAMGVRGWCPTLPDPYVSNVGAVAPPKPSEGSTVSSALYAQARWSGPGAVTMSFAGRLVGASAEAMKGRTDPQRQDDDRPQVDIGLTQVAQHRLRLGKQAHSRRERARGEAAAGRAKRLKTAAKSNADAQAQLRGVWDEFVDARPNVVLLDVSTNQDLLGVAIEARGRARSVVATHLTHASPTVGGRFVVDGLDVHTPLSRMIVLTLPAVQWEPVRTLDPDQDIMTLGWFPTPLASSTDGGPSLVGVRSQRLAPIVPDDALRETQTAFGEGVPVGLHTTLPFGLMATAVVTPNTTPSRLADRFEITRPNFPSEDAVGGRQITAIAEDGRPAEGISPMFQGAMRQLINGVELATGAPLGLSVLGSTADPGGSVETVFNNDMAANPRVPVTRFDLSGYGASNFSEWDNPFAAFAESAKVQFSVIVGRTALEVIKVNSVLHPWGIRVTRSVTVERRPGGGVIRRDSGWQPITSGLFDYRYADSGGNLVVAPYRFDAGVFRGLFKVRSIRPAPGSEVSAGGATFVPYYFDADLALDGASDRTAAVGVLGYLQTQPNGSPASVSALQQLVESQGTIGGPLDAWIDVGNSGLPFRVRRVEVGVAPTTSGPVFVATVRGVPRLPTTGAWSVVKRPVAGTPLEQREAVPVGDSRGVPLVRRYPVAYPAGSDATFDAPPLDGPPSAAGSYRFADAADLFELSDPAHEYALLQSTPTHAFIFPRPFIAGSGIARIETGGVPALADVIARTTSKGAFPPPPNAIDLSSGLFFDVAPSGTLSLSNPVHIVGHPTPLRLLGTDGHGSKLEYNNATLRLELDHDRWEAEFSSLEIHNDVAGLERVSGSRMRVVGSTQQRPQIAEVESLVLPDIEKIMQFIPLFGQRGVDGPIDLGATNAKHEFKFEASLKVDVPKASITIAAGADLKLKLKLSSATGFDKDTGAVKSSGKLGIGLEGKIPVLSVGVASVFVIVSVGADFSIEGVVGGTGSEKLALNAFAGVGVEGAIGPFKAYAYLGVGFILSYDITNDKTKYGGLVALEAGIDFTVVAVKVRAELKGLCYDDAGVTKCDYSGSVKVQVDIFLIFSISASYEVSDTTTI